MAPAAVKGLPTYPSRSPPVYTAPLPAEKRTMIRLPQIKNRVVRLRELAEAIGREARAQKHHRRLSPGERRDYLDALQRVIKGFDDARHALTVAVKRMEQRGR